MSGNHGVDVVHFLIVSDKLVELVHEVPIIALEVKPPSFYVIDTSPAYSGFAPQRLLYYSVRSGAR
jgi:hypothetical protein